MYLSRPRKPRYWLHLLLFLGTIFSTLVVGSRIQFNFLQGHPAFYAPDDNLALLFQLSWALHSGHIWLGIPFSFTLMLILFAHEMGHYLYCVRYRVAATLPFFIPFPTLIGTLGAFIRIRSPIRSRSQLFDIGIAGPIAGFCVALAALILSLPYSKPMPRGMEWNSIQLGFPLVFRLVHSLWVLARTTNIATLLPLDRQLLHPVAIAAWVGMFATSLNLLPGGQLDGGHIVFSLAPRLHRQVSRIVVIALLPMAFYFSISWFIWAIVIRLTSMRHPMVPEWPPVTPARRYLGLVALLMLILTLIPAPFAHNSGIEVLQSIRSGH